MEAQSEPIRLENYSLDEIVRLLMAGTPVHRAKGTPFRFDTSDKRKAFAFYSRNRELWRSNRTVQAKEVESLLKALEEDLPADTAMPPHGTTDKPVWHLERVEIHRFGGLHRHVGPNGEDPEDFVVEFDKEITLVSGFNGAGKTALLSAIIWCLTGKALRSQHMPQQIHEPMAVKWTDAGEEASEGEDIHPEIAVPPLVPVPAAEDLVKLGDKPKLDTGVRLTFRREDTGEIHHVARQLEVLGKKLAAPVEGLDVLGLSALAIEVGTLMPGVAAQMRFDEKTDFTQAVSQLTGLKPLQELGRRSERLVNRLRKAEKKATGERRDEKLNQFKTQLQTLNDGWAEHSDLGEPQEILLPGEVVERKEEGSDSTYKINCRSTLAASRAGLQDMQSVMSRDLEKILGHGIELTAQRQVDSITHVLDNAADRLKGGALRELPTVALLLDLGGIPDNEAALAIRAVQGIRERSHALSEKLKDEQQAARWRLYSRVAAWHRDNHPDEDFSSCPVCGTDLESVPGDALLDISVREALEQCRETDSGIAKTVAEWEHDESAGLLDALPTSVRGYADKTLPSTLLAMCRQGYVEELLGHEAFAGKLKELQESGKAVWDIATGESRLPEAPRPVESDLPAMLAGGKLQKRLSAIAHGLMLRAHQKSGGDALKSILARYIGTVTPVGEGVEPASAGGASLDGEKEWRPERASLREQIESIRRAVQNAMPIVSLIRQLDNLETVRQEWDAQANRLLLLARAADAVEPYLAFPELVYERVSGLIETLDRDTAGWLSRIYRPHYRGGPSYGGFEPDEDSRFGLRAGIGDLRVPAHQVMNASLLKACVWAFLFALWEHVRKHSGCISCVLLDDLQTHFDPINSENLAAVVPQMPTHGMRPLIVSNDVRFVASIQDKLPSSATSSSTWTAQRIDPVSSSKLTASLSPAIEEIRERRDRWKEDDNNVPKAQDFVKCVRVDMENRLWNLLATDPLVMHSPTLGDLLGQLRHARNGGERPFDERPFEKLLSHPALRETDSFYRIINKAHHRPLDITPQDAADVYSTYEHVHGILRSCTASYARFLGRLAHEDHEIVLTDAPAAPTVVSMSDAKLSVLGRLAARSGSDILAVAEDSEKFEIESLGPVALYAVRGSTLGLVALAGQVVVVSLDREAYQGEAVVALHGEKAYARRFHRDRRHLSRTILAADSSGSANVPPAILIPTAATRVMPVIGVLYDAQTIPSPDEAVAVKSSEILDRKLVAARIVEDSAYPVICNGDMVLMEEIEEMSQATMENLEGRIVALTARNGGESFGYLKRLGQRIGDGIRIYENIGLNGQAVCVADGESVATGKLPCLERLWRVHGFLRPIGIPLDSGLS